MAAPQLSKELAQQALDTMTAHGGVGAGARALGIPRATMNTRVDTAKRYKLTPKVQRLLGDDPAAPPEGYMLKGTSTYVNKNGVQAGQWIKTDRAIEQLYKLQHKVLEQLKKELKPLKRIAAPKVKDADLLSLYTMTDCHVGMLAWDKETGEDWDLSIAEACLTNTFLQMIDSAPAAATGIVNQLGDFLHFDSLTPETPAHKHVLDADSRYQKVVEVAVRILRRVIEHALTKHDKVRVYMNEGNHDPAGSVWLRVMFAQLYADNPRVYVERSPNPYVAYLHGETLIGFHHGHLSKTVKLPQIFSQQFRTDWGKSTHAYVHTGHLHHVEEKEHPGVNVIQHPTLAAKDAYAARGGWLSKRQATRMDYHKIRGEVGRATLIPAT